MAQKFFENTLVSQFIKNILANAPVPVIPTATYYDYIIQDNFYVLVDKIIRCTKSGYVKAEEGQTQASYFDIQHYEFGRAYPKLTETYFSNESYYDPETHEHLGKFLRCLRDTKYIDLMPFYNCFNYKSFKGSLVEEEWDPDEETENSDTKTKIVWTGKSSAQYKLFVVPISLNKTYTIYMDAGNNVSLLPVLFTEHRELKDDSNNTFLNESHYKDPENQGSVGKYFAYVNFTNPITYKLDSSLFDNESTLATLEKYLYLCIQVPKSCNSSIVILEGDYKEVQSEKIFDASFMNDQVLMNKLLLKNLSLTLANNKTVYAFSDKLVEFLLLAVVNSQDDIIKNTTRLQNMAEMTRLNGYIPNVWTVEMRRKFFETYLKEAYVDGSLKTDVTGFGDSKIEKMLLQGEYTRLTKGE